MHFFAYAAFESKVCFLAGLSSCHSPLVDWRFGVLAVITDASLSAVLGALHASMAHRVSGVSALLLTLDYLVLCVFFARRAVFLASLWKLHVCLGRGGV